MAGFTEKEKEKQKKLLVFDLAKRFMSNLTAILDIEDDWAWFLLYNKFTLSDNKLTLKFKLKESVVEEEVKKLDKAQQTLDKDFGKDPQVIPI